MKAADSQPTSVDSAESGLTLGRRAFLAAAAAGSAGAFVGFERVAQAATVLPGFPAGVTIARERYQNWDETISTAPLWTVEPADRNQLLATVNWAAANGYRVRAKGFQHTWAPWTVTPKETSDTSVVLVDLRDHFADIAMVGDDRVRVGAGATMESLLAHLDRHDRGITACPAPGQITVGGALAINGHGTAIRAAQEQRARGMSYGSLSNLVTAMTVVSWDASTHRFVLRELQRNSPEIAPYLTLLGRGLVVDVTLQVGQRQYFHCRNRTEITASRLFAAPESMTDSALARLVDKYGRVGVIWYAFTDRPWVQTWEISPRRPLGALPRYSPYAYLFADNLPDPVPQILGDINEGAEWLAPAFGNAILAATDVGLTLAGNRSMWGASKNFLNWVRPTTLRITAGSHAVIVARKDLQSVVHDFTTFYSELLKKYQRRGQFPINSGLEIRISGVDTPAEVDVPGAVAPAFSAAAPDPEHPERDTVVWLDTLTLPETPHTAEFYTELDEYFEAIGRDKATVRVEWSKRWGYRDGVAWSNADHLAPTKASLPQWDAATAVLRASDPHKVFVTKMHEVLGID